MFNKILVLIFIITCISTSSSFASLEPKRDLSFKEYENFVEVRNKDNQLFTQYYFKKTPLPYLSPIQIYNETSIVQSRADDKIGSIIQGLTLAYQDINKTDFWNSGANGGSIIQSKLEYDSINPGYWNIHATNEWVNSKGKKLFEEDRRYSFISTNYGVMISVASTILAGESDIKFGNSDKGFLMLSLADNIFTNNDRVVEIADKTNGRYFAVVGDYKGKPCTVAIFNAKEFYGYPNVYKYKNGILSVNPFIPVKYKDVKRDSNVVIKKTESGIFVYSIIVSEQKLDSQTLENIADELSPSSQPGKK